VEAVTALTQLADERQDRRRVGLTVQLQPDISVAAGRVHSSHRRGHWFEPSIAKEPQVSISFGNTDSAGVLCTCDATNRQDLY
jgi:hypothetical protein